MSESAWIVDVTEPTFDVLVIEKSGEIPVVVDFWAPWCQPCKMLGPVLESLAEEYAGKFLLAKVDTDQHPGLAQRFGVGGIPMVMAFVDGEVAGQFVGVVAEEEIRVFLDGIFPSESEKFRRQADELAASNAAEALNLYEQAVVADPKNSLALAGLAETCLATGELDRAEEEARRVSEGTDGWTRANNVLAQAQFRRSARELGTPEECQARCDADPDDLQARVNLGMVQAGQGMFADALETLLGVVRKDRVFGAEHAKEMMVRIFNIVGPQSELANRYRPKLATALY